MQKYLLLKFMGCLVLAFSLLLFMSKIDAQEDGIPAPYLYYYSGILNAFVIERADGTDSRILAQDVVPKKHNEIHEPEWSPSGEWLAWRSAEFGGPGPSYYSGWINRSDGTERLTILDHPDDVVVNVDVMEWALDADMLFVVQTVTDENRENVSRQLLLISAEEGVVVASHSFNTPYFNADYGIPFVWLPDNQGVVAYESNFQDDLFAPQIIALFTDGNVETEMYSAWTFMGLSPDGRFAYVSEDKAQLVIRGLLDDSTETYMLTSSTPTSEFANRSTYLTWSSEYNVAAYFMRQEEDFDLWLLDSRKQELSILKPDVSTLNVPCERDRSLFCSRYGLWSPDGLHFIFKTTDELHWLFELDSQEIILLEDFPAYETISWADNNHQLILENSEGVHVYDVVSQQYTLVLQLMGSDGYSELLEGMTYFPSPDGKYIGLLSSRMISLSTGTVTELTIHSGAVYATSMVIGYDWYPDGAWIITRSNVTYAGCCGPSAYTVLRINGSLVESRRELTVRWGDSAGWIPERVIPHLAEGQPESVLQLPALTYRFSSAVLGLAWNPNGNDIVAVTGSGQVFVRTMGSGTTQRPVFTTDARCSINLDGLPCPIYWENGTIITGDRVWNTEQQTYLPSDTVDRIVCDDYGCSEVQQDIISANGRWMAQLDETNSLDVIDQYTGEIIKNFEVETYNRILPFEWVNDKLIMIVDHEITIFDVNTGETTTLESVRDRGYKDSFSLVRMSPDETFLAGASMYTPIHIWDFESGELVTVVNWYGYDIAFSPDSQWLAAGNTNLITIWDVSQYVADE